MKTIEDEHKEGIGSFVMFRQMEPKDMQLHFYPMLNMMFTEAAWRLLLVFTYDP